MKETYPPPDNVWPASRVFFSPLFSHIPISASPQTFLSRLLRSVCLFSALPAVRLMAGLCAEVK